MLISACYITKNAETFLDYSIASIKDYVDEIIIVDDNSTDSTLEIAKKHNAYIIHGIYNGDKTKQRNEYLKIAQGKWILVVDDDEVYKRHEIEALRKWIKEHGDKYTVVRYNFTTFWKTPHQVITGHMWNMQLERCFKNIDGLNYKIHHMVSDKAGDFLSGGKYQRPCLEFLRVYHYSYCKTPEYIRKKIKYYMLRDNPNVTKENVDIWVDKHPYFSGVYNQHRYGLDGLYVAGMAYGIRECVLPFKEKHPVEMLEHPLVKSSYLDKANRYMEEHWQYHNHLHHSRHQERIKYTAEHCIGNTVEVGCANGFSTMTMQKHNPKCTFSGVEPTDWGYASAERNYPYLKFYKALGENLPFGDERFDTVLLAEVIEHCADPMKLVDEAWRVTKKRLIITTPTQKHDDPDHKRFYTLSQLKLLMEKYGLPGYSGLDIEGKREKNPDKIYFQIMWVDKKK